MPIPQRFQRPRALRSAAAALPISTFLVFAFGNAGGVPGDAGAEPVVRILGRDHATIPIDTRNSHVAIRGRVNGSDSVWITIDTGASSGALDVGFARTLGLVASGQHESMGAGGPVTGTTVRNVTIELPGLRIHREEMDALEMAAVGAPSGQPLHVILGAELFMHHVVVMDYEAGVMEVWPPAIYRAPRGGTVLPITLIENHPYVEAAVALPGRAPLAGRFVIDTGSSLAVLLSAETAQRENAATAFPRTLEAVGRGVGGELRNTIGRAESLTLGSERIAGPIVVCPSVGAGRVSAPGTVGNIGGQVLRRFRVTFDYPHRRVRLEPNRSRLKPFEADMTGATIVFAAELGLARVTVVRPGTPAAEVGMQAGDVIESLDGEGIAALGYSEFRERLKHDGREVRLGIRRGDRLLSLTLRLRRQI